MNTDRVTLIAVDCVETNAAADMLRHCASLLPFGAVVLLSDNPPQDCRGLKWYRIQPIRSIEAYCRFVLTELPDYVHTEFALNVQTDGYILNPEKWEDSFLDYDYIGAPWPDYILYRPVKVGNSGFCLRSKRLMKACAKLAGGPQLESHRERWGCVLDDQFICQQIRPELVAAGMRFAPVDVAGRFAFEQPTEEIPAMDHPFGFHGKLTPETIEHSRRFVPATWGKLRLVQNWYWPKEKRRTEELLFALQSNIRNEAIDEILLCVEAGAEEGRAPRGGKVTVVPICGGNSAASKYRGGRVSFAAMVAAASGSTTKPTGTVVLVANTDIRFDESVSLLKRLSRHQFAAIGRWSGGCGFCGRGGTMEDRPDMQDAWAWVGECRIPLQQLDFHPGYPGCDNRLAYLAQEAGYEVCNPGKTIVLHHEHASDIRTYPASDSDHYCPDRVPAPYLHIWPHAWGASPRRIVLNEWPENARQANELQQISG